MTTHADIFLLIPATMSDTGEVTVHRDESGAIVSVGFVFDRGRNDAHNPPSDDTLQPGAWIRPRKRAEKNTLEGGHCRSAPRYFAWRQGA